MATDDVNELFFSVWLKHLNMCFLMWKKSSHHWPKNNTKSHQGEKGVCQLRISTLFFQLSNKSNPKKKEKKKRLLVGEGSSVKACNNFWGQMGHFVSSLGQSVCSICLTTPSLSFVLRFSLCVPSSESRESEIIMAGTKEEDVKDPRIPKIASSIRVIPDFPKPGLLFFLFSSH